MNAKEWARIDSVVDQVLELPSGERGILVERLCAGDDDLEAAVNAFLRDCDVAATLYDGLPVTGASDLLQAPAELPHPPFRLRPGERLGVYRIVRILGYGGMGAVYLAERADGVFEKRMALKVLRRGVQSELAVKSFRDERQMLAQLEHPNIARLHDGGITEDGLPFFVMEHVRGVPIDEYADAKRLSVDQRLRLFEQACAAVSYAHRHLVVHQDLKPSNILVSGTGQVKLVDFGIGKRLKGGGGELGGGIASGRLTLAYASPEQVSGRPTGTSTDVYSLGVVLYELVCGRSPYAATPLNPRLLQAAIVREAPRPPSEVLVAPVGDGALRAAPEWLASARKSTVVQLRRLVSGDIDAILLKALAKTPSDRYPSPDDLWSDIARHLNGYPVRARRRTRTYAASRFVRRHRTGVTALALVVLAVVVAALSALREWRARTEMLEAQQAMLEFGELLLTSFDPDGPSEALERVEGRFRSRIEAFNMGPEESASLMIQVGEQAFQREHWPIATTFFESADSLLRTDRGRHHPLRNVALRGVGRVRLKQYETTEAIAWFRAALEVIEVAADSGGRELAETLNDLGFSLAAALNNPADVEVGSRLRRRDAILQEVRVLASRSLSVPLTGPDSLDIRGRTFETLAEAYYAGERYEQAAEEYSRVAALVQRDRLGSESPRLGELWLYLGQTYNGWASQLLSEGGDSAAQSAMARYEQADDYLREARDHLLKFHSSRHSDVAAATYELGENAFWRCDFGEAARRYREAVEAWANAPEARQRLYAQHALGRTLLLLGQSSEALRMLTAARERYRTEPSLADRAASVEQLIQAGRAEPPKHCASESER